MGSNSVFAGPKVNTLFSLDLSFFIMEWNGSMESSLWSQPTQYFCWSGQTVLKAAKLCLLRQSLQVRFCFVVASLKLMKFMVGNGWCYIHSLSQMRILLLHWVNGPAQIFVIYFFINKFLISNSIRLKGNLQGQYRALMYTVHQSPSLLASYNTIVYISQLMSQ